jgi:hypothetical protein
MAKAFPSGPNAAPATSGSKRRMRRETAEFMLGSCQSLQCRLMGGKLSFYPGTNFRPFSHPTYKDSLFES